MKEYGLQAAKRLETGTFASLNLSMRQKKDVDEARCRGLAARNRLSAIFTASLNLLVPSTEMEASAHEDLVPLSASSSTSLLDDPMSKTYVMLALLLLQFPPRNPVLMQPQMRLLFKLRMLDST